MNDFNSILALLQSRQNLNEDQMAQAIGTILTGSMGQTAIMEFLSALYEKGETDQELAGAARAMRTAMLTVSSTVRPVLDTCGTGGDGSKTFNISTAAAIVLAATGCRVAKHGNRKITSSTGSADVLAELGINLEASPSIVERCLNEIGLCFCFAPNFHPAMRHVALARRQLSHPTIFNRLGPLTNPALAEHQVIGVGDVKLQPLLANTLQRLGTVRSLVVRGDDGVDEISISAPTSILEVQQSSIISHHWTPEDFDVAFGSRQDLYADNPASSADSIRRVLTGERGASRDVVVINAAAALWLTQCEQCSLKECSKVAQYAIDSGRASELLRNLARLTNASAT